MSASPNRADADAARVIDLMQGAWRGPHDPDADLGHLLHELEDAGDSAMISALTRLVRDADPD